MIYNTILLLLMATAIQPNICRIKNVIRGFSWSKYMWIMAVVVPFALLGFQLGLTTGTIPGWFMNHYVILTFADPNIVSMFLSNYAHVNLNHLISNTVTYIFIMMMIATVALVAIPYNNRKTKGSQCQFGTRTLLWSTLVFFIVVPFIISAVSIIAGPMNGKTSGVGFSGIVYAFEGYLVYICELIIIRKTQVMTAKGHPKWIVFGALIGLMLIVSPILTTNPLDGESNYVAHLSGFVVGVMTPLLIDMWIRFKQVKISQKSISSNNGGTT